MHAKLNVVEKQILINLISFDLAIYIVNVANRYIES